MRDKIARETANHATSDLNALRHEFYQVMNKLSWQKFEMEQRVKKLEAGMALLEEANKQRHASICEMNLDIARYRSALQGRINAISEHLGGEVKDDVFVKEK